MIKDEPENEVAWQFWVIHQLKKKIHLTDFKMILYLERMHLYPGWQLKYQALSR